MFGHCTDLAIRLYSSFDNLFPFSLQGVQLNISTFHFLIHVCSRASAFKQGSEVHRRILKSGFGNNLSLTNNLMGMYKSCGKLKAVCQLFENLPSRDVVNWNTMISCYVTMGLYREVLDSFRKMIVNGVSPDEITMVSLVSASAKLRDVKMGEALHLYIEEKNLSIVGSSVDMYIKCGKMEEAQKLLDRSGADDVDVVLGTTLISGYVKSNKIDAARFLFDQMTERSLISWTAMISGYVQGGYFCESL
ncbi:pentatricopeptide repeat-containing protein At2g29760, chloroplastic-like [Pistacia vera]|uniref:pentatricopeptide repeat-containing protein At2g29760, chloroplastic-like n=1 Tax=Pistacia vera TaxID=55513 RepID=UPI001263CF4A|nr:pentatricopeptide repeat-containing protein At2g29760, chloroplastic-like [Pistacia vera]